MIAVKTVEQYLNNYLTVFPNETERCGLFSSYLSRNKEEALFDRKNFDGHITTSAFIIRKNGSKYEVLLLEHKSLKRWLQPGGHAELNDKSLIKSALREAVEETGISEDKLVYTDLLLFKEMPFDIDSHYIPENTKKNEAGHYHHDIRYIFTYSGDDNYIYNEEESTGMKWVDIDSLANDETFGFVAKKIISVISHNKSII